MRGEGSRPKIYFIVRREVEFQVFQVFWYFIGMKVVNLRQKSRKWPKFDLQVAIEFQKNPNLKSGSLVP